MTLCLNLDRLRAIRAELAVLQVPSKAIDREMAKCIGWHRVEPRFARSKHGAWIAPEDWIGQMGDGSPILDSLHGTDMWPEVPHYTGDLEKTLAWLNSTNASANWFLGKGQVGPTEPVFGAIILEGDREIGTGEHCSSPAIALCIAAVDSLIGGGRPTLSTQPEEVRV